MARLAGVSQATVSLVLGAGKAGATITEETRRKVFDAVRRLGYVPDPAASRLAAARNHLLGVFSFTATFPTEVQHSYYPFLVGVEQEAAVRGYDLALFTGSSTGGGAGAAGAGALDRARLADGCLFPGRQAPAGELGRRVADGFPVVHLGRRDEPEDLARVGADYISASHEVVTHLASLGHRRIVLVREDDEAPASTDREQGFLKGLEEAGLPAGPAAVCSCPTCSSGRGPAAGPCTPVLRTPTYAGATPTPATETSWPPHAGNAPASAARKASAGADAPSALRLERPGEPMRSEH
ncbi:LacI family DNA-binding transcriptional regulator [Streptomyces axinellae]|uniref:LacI family DNA-binding transcriptional regulator n=1 Tax=Streptomyces axinellae TaxID=552788 RepID=UPI0031D33C15